MLWIRNIVLIALIFGAGFCVGVLDNIYNPNNIIAPNKINVPKYDVFGTCIDSARPVYIDGNIDSYFVQCFCMVETDETAGSMWLDLASVNHLTYRAKNPQDAITDCEKGCDKLCKRVVAKHLESNPDFQIPHRW